MVDGCGAATCAAVKFVGYLDSYPAGGFAAVTTAAAGTPLAFTGANASNFASPAVTVRQTTSATTITGAAKPATATDGVGAFSFTPTKVGTYVLKVFNDTGTGAGSATLNNTPDATEFVQSISITVTASATLAPSASTSFMTAAGLDGAAATAGTGAGASSTTNALPRTATKAIGRSIAQIKVSLFKDDGNTDAAANTVSCIVSGVGFCIVNTTPDTYAAATARSATDNTAAAVRYVHVGTDGTAGTGTVTVSVTGVVSGVETTIGTHTYATYGDVSALAVSTTNGTIGKAGKTTGGASTTRVAAEATLGLLGASTTLPAFIVKATDSAGRVANAAAAPTIASSNGLAVVSGTCALDGGLTATAADNDYKSSTNGVGFYNCSFSAPASAASGAKSTLTISIPDPADATKTISTTIAVTIGGSVSTEVISFDKLAYAPGEAMVVTRTAKDSSGNPVADGTASPEIKFSKAVGGTAPAAGFYAGGASASSTTVAKASVFAPTTPGAFSAIATSSATGSPTITSSATVTDANAGLMTQIDALNAKIVALNALIAKIMKKLGVK